jgi:hypothetical protein
MIPPISDDSKLKIRETCQLVHKTHRYFHTAIVDEQGTETHEIGCVEGRDIRDLIQPDMMSSNLLDFIFYSQFPSNDNQVTYVSSVVANAVLDCELNFESLIANEVLFGFMIQTMNMMFKAPVMIFGFCRGEHITGIIVNSVVNSSAYIIQRLTFLDSLQGDGTRSVDTVLAFLQWLATHKGIMLDTSNIQRDSTPTAHMIRQRPYRPPGANPDRGIQIDCGIYFFLMVLI